MKIAIPKERRDHETRVAGSPDSVKKLADLGADVFVENGAGAGASYLDAAYEKAGAKIVSDVAELLGDADVVLKVRRPLSGESPDELAAMQSGAVLIGMLQPFGDAAHVEAMAKAGLTTFSLEFLPRITRAQTMDVLSSQSNLAGYRSVIDAAAEFARAFPMMMTAAGTVPPARVMVMGAGVAGLQAIATARRMGAVVSATDVRPAAKEQVESLGATFVAVEDEEFKQAETAGGYAKEMSDAYKKKQAELIAETIKKQDIVITTALIPGRPAPTLIDEAMVQSMKPGSIINDLAVEQGGNCALSKAGEVVVQHDVKIIGHLNVPGRVAVDASSLYARNLLNFLTPMVDKETKALKIDWDDEIMKSTCLTRDGEVVNPRLKGKEPEPMNPDTLIEKATGLANQAEALAREAAGLATAIGQLTVEVQQVDGGHFVAGLTVLVLAIFVGYHVVWRVTPALHSPLMAVTNAISSVIIVGALIAAGPVDFNFSKVMGFLAVILAAVNIFGGFIVTQRMLSMFKKKQK